MLRLSVTKLRSWLFSLLALSLVVFGALPAVAEQVTVFAAASMKSALDDLHPVWEAQSDHQLTVSYASSAALARQIAAGAPADVFVSANAVWMDYLSDQLVIQEQSRVDLVANNLVLIGPAGAPPGPIETVIARDLGDEFLAMGLVNAVPAGIYGKAALTDLGLWPLVSSQVAQTDNVRAALALVSLGEAPLGIVYATDALADDRVAVLAKIAPETHEPIVYPAALTREANTPAAEEFYDFLTSPVAKAVFLRHGFTEPSVAE